MARFTVTYTRVFVIDTYSGWKAGQEAFWLMGEPRDGHFVIHNDAGLKPATQVEPASEYVPDDPDPGEMDGDHATALASAFGPDDDYDSRN